MFVFDRLSPYSYYNNKEKYKDDDEDEKRDFSLKESLWFCMTSLTPQGKITSVVKIYYLCAKKCAFCIITFGLLEYFVSR